MTNPKKIILQTEDVTVEAVEEALADSERLFDNAAALAKQIIKDKNKSLLLLETIVLLLSELTGLDEQTVQDQFGELINRLVEKKGQSSASAERVLYIAPSKSNLLN